VLELLHVRSCNRWRRAAELLLDQADVATVSKQVKLALFHAQLDLKSME
jgi:predicted phage-related endonuclease